MIMELPKISIDKGHYSDAIWSWEHLKSLATGQVVQQLIQTNNNKKNLCVEGIY